MAEKTKSYKQLKEELDVIIVELESSAEDIDKAIEQYKKGQTIIAKIEEYLKKAKVKINVLKPPK